MRPSCQVIIGVVDRTWVFDDADRMASKVKGSAYIDAVIRTTWWQRFMAGAILVALGACVFGTGAVALYLERRGLDDADKIASVGGFFLTGLGLVLAFVSVVQGFFPRSPAGPASPSIQPDSVPSPAPAISPLIADLVRLRDIMNVDHERLFGVDRELVSLGESLSNPDATWLISIFGGAGVGKTALAYELVRQYATAAGFQRVASVSAKFSHIDRVGHVERDTERENTDWRDLLVELAQQLAPGMDFNDGLIDQQLPAAMPTEPFLHWWRKTPEVDDPQRQHRRLIPSRAVAYALVAAGVVAGTVFGLWHGLRQPDPIRSALFHAATSGIDVGILSVLGLSIVQRYASDAQSAH